MKKLILGALAFALLLAGGCDEMEKKGQEADRRFKADSEWVDCRNCTDVRLIDVEGHRYLVVRAGGGLRGGVSAVHAESCPCKEARK